VIRRNPPPPPPEDDDRAGVSFLGMLTYVLVMSALVGLGIWGIIWLVQKLP
jgi:hypothetical protein